MQADSSLFLTRHFFYILSLLGLLLLTKLVVPQLKSGSASRVGWDVIEGATYMDELAAEELEVDSTAFAAMAKHHSHTVVKAHHSHSRKRASEPLVVDIHPGSLSCFIQGKPVEVVNRYSVLQDSLLSLFCGEITVPPPEIC